MNLTARILLYVAIVCAPATAPAQLNDAVPSTSTVTVDEAVHEALDRNLDLLAEKYNLSIAEARLITARLRPNPVLSVEGDHLDLLGTGYNSRNGAGPPEFSIRTDFILERGRKRDNRMAVAENGKEVAELQFLNSIRTITLDVQNAFVEALLARESVALARENLKAFEEIVGVNKVRVRSGYPASACARKG